MDWMSLGYIGVFLANFISSLTLFFPVPAFVLLATLSKTLNPPLLILAASLGSTLGELSAYVFGSGVLHVVKEKNKFKNEHEKQWKRVRGLFKRYGGAAVIFVFSLTPLPFDIIGIFCGYIKYDMKKFLIATFLGRLALSIIIVYGSILGIDFVLEFLNYSAV